MGLLTRSPRGTKVSGWRVANVGGRTPLYMAPEVMCRQNHGIEVDYFALGVICYECMKGRVRPVRRKLIYKRPYLGRSRKEIRD